MNEKQTILVDIDLFEIPATASAAPKLIASKCKNCGEITFPKQIGCPNCCRDDVEEVKIGPKAKLFSFTNVNYPVPEGYKGPVPYGVGVVDFAEGARIVTHLTEHDPAKLQIGMDMVLIIDKLFEDEAGNEIIGFKFKPV
jgi:uncharacterized OB-fold protein